MVYLITSSIGSSIPSSTAYKQHFGADFRGPIIPFGTKVPYKPSGEMDIDDMPRLGTKLREGIFVGYDQNVGGAWSGDLYVLDSLQLAALESIYQIYVRRIQGEEASRTRRTTSNSLALLEKFCSPMEIPRFS